jgi:hypothetical protein
MADPQESNGAFGEPLRTRRVSEAAAATLADAAQRHSSAQQALHLRRHMSASAGEGALTTNNAVAEVDGRQVQKVPTMRRARFSDTDLPNLSVEPEDAHHNCGAEQGKAAEGGTSGGQDRHEHARRQGLFRQQAFAPSPSSDANQHQMGTQTWAQASLLAMQRYGMQRHHSIAAPGLAVMEKTHELVRVQRFLSLYRTTRTVAVAGSSPFTPAPRLDHHELRQAEHSSHASESGVGSAHDALLNAGGIAHVRKAAAAAAAAAAGVSRRASMPQRGTAEADVLDSGVMSCSQNAAEDAKEAGFHLDPALAVAEAAALAATAASAETVLNGPMAEVRLSTPDICTEKGGRVTPMTSPTQNRERGHSERSLGGMGDVLEAVNERMKPGDECIMASALEAPGHSADAGSLFAAIVSHKAEQCSVLGLRYTHDRGYKLELVAPVIRGASVEMSGDGGFALVPSIEAAVG